MSSPHSASPVAGVARLALLGTGTVGSAFVARYQALKSSGQVLPVFHGLANSRSSLVCSEALEQALHAARHAPGRPAGGGAEASVAPAVDSLRAGDVVVDATASDAIAATHARWLERGIHVVTANKLGQGAHPRRAADIAARCDAAGACYGDSATVGAGLPLLSSLRALVAGGDRIHRIEGVLSGSMAWLFHRHDGQQPFSALVRQAVQQGLTEPDPRLDLSGEDVRRKLIILARASGWPLDTHEIRVDSLVPRALAACSTREALDALDVLDDPLHDAWSSARKAGTTLRFIGRVDGQGAYVGLQALALDHPLAAGTGTDNRVAIYSDRYRNQPLLIQGPGAGADVTAAALLDDVLRIAKSHGIARVQDQTMGSIDLS